MKIIGVTGKPASGKSVVSEQIAEIGGFPMVEMGDIVEKKAAEYLGVSVTELTSNQKGEAATELREEYGETVFASETVDELSEETNAYAHDVGVVSGVRTPEEINVFTTESEFTLVLVTAPFETRYQRFTSRGREDEAEFSRDDFTARTERELSWGLETVLDRELYDVEIQNNGGVSDLQGPVNDLVSGL